MGIVSMGGVICYNLCIVMQQWRILYLKVSARMFSFYITRRTTHCLTQRETIYFAMLSQSIALIFLSLCSPFSSRLLRSLIFGVEESWTITFIPVTSVPNIFPNNFPSPVKQWWWTMCIDLNRSFNIAWVAVNYPTIFKPITRNESKDGVSCYP